MDRNKSGRKKLNKRQIMLIAAVALAAVLLLTGRLTPAGLINSLLGTDIPELVWYTLFKQKIGEGYG